MDAYIEFESWLLQQPLWLQEAAFLILKHGDISAQDERRLMDLCIKEAAGEKIKIDHFESGLIVKQGSLKKVSIRSINNVLGVNAIKQTRALEFDVNGINVVYGDNGSGKTGYIRLLKKISQSRFSDDILQNIYDEKTIQNQTCDIEVQCDFENQVMHIDLNAMDSKSSDLQNIAIFDTRAGATYLKESLSATYEPWIFTFIERLVKTCDRIKASIDDYDSELEVPEIKVPLDLIDTSVQEYITKLNFKSKPQECEIRDLESHLKQIKVLESELADSFIAQYEPTKRDIGISERIRLCLHSVALIYTEENIEVSKQLVTNIQTATNDAKNITTVFSDDSGDINISAELWKSMWEAVEQYSIQELYKNTVFPYLEDDAICPFCRQSLTFDTRLKLKSIKESIASDYAKKEQAARIEYLSFLNGLTLSTSVNEVKILLDASDVFSEVEANQILDLVKSAFQCIDDAKSRYTNLIKIDVGQYLIKVVNYIENKRQDLIKIEALMDDASRLQKERQLSKLKIEHFLHESIPALIETVDIKQRKDIAKRAKTLAATNKLTTKSKQLAVELITENYIKRFNKELKALAQSNLRASLEEQKAGKGKVPFKVVLNSTSENGIEPVKVLSEGEQRAISLALFLADVLSNESNSSIVFDDPVSSLDQGYVDSFVKRVVELGESNQVIIFTHRLSLVSHLSEEADKGITKCCQRCIETWGGRKYSGNPVGKDIFPQKPREVMKNIRNELLPRLRKLEYDNSPESEDIALLICQKIRLCIERCVEVYIFNEVVIRFRKEIQTQGRILKLSTVTSDDYKFVDEFMTKYSRYLHAVSIETPIRIPSSLELDDDLSKAIEWADGIHKRLGK